MQRFTEQTRTDEARSGRPSTVTSISVKEQANQRIRDNMRIGTEKVHLEMQQLWDDAEQKSHKAQPKTFLS
jgi:hypothetical protein